MPRISIEPKKQRPQVNWFFPPEVMKCPDEFLRFHYEVIKEPWNGSTTQLPKTVQAKFNCSSVFAFSIFSMIDFLCAAPHIKIAELNLLFLL